MTRRDILARHRQSLDGTLRACYLPSKALGINKSFYVYEPPGFHKEMQLPVLYLFRGHEREWVNIDEDSSRQRATAIEDIDKAIALRMIPPVLVVMPGLNSSNRMNRLIMIPLPSQRLTINPLRSLQITSLAI